MKKFIQSSLCGCCLLAAAKFSAAHPSLYFQADDLPAIRERVIPGQAGELMNLSRVMAVRFAELEVEPYASDGAYTGRNILAHIGNLAWVGWVDENSAYLEQARAILMAAVNQFSVADYERFNGHLAVADAGWALPIAYDWLEPVLSDSEKVLVRQRIREIGEYLYNDSVVIPRRGLPEPVGAMIPSRLAHNHGVVVHAGLYLCGTILGRQEWVEHAAPRIRGYVEHFQDGSGAPFEGIGYADYGLEAVALVNAVSLRHGGEDLTAGVAGAGEFGRFVLHHTVPRGHAIIPQNQSSHQFSGLGGLFYLVQHFDDAIGRHAWEQLLPEGGIYAIAQGLHTSHARMFPFLALWHQADAAVHAPDENIAPFKAWKRGMVAARTAWNDPMAALFTFQSGRQHIGIWDHADENSFTFTAFGDNLLLDPGHSLWGGEHHNTVLIDGAGQLGRGPGHFVEGRLLRAEDRGNSVYVVGDAAEAYRFDALKNDVGLPVQIALRRVLFVRAPYPLLVIVDQVKLETGQKHRFSWRGIYNDRMNNNGVELLADENAALITGARQGATAKVRVLYPAEIEMEQGTVQGANRMRAGYVDFHARQQSLRGDFVTLISAAEGSEGHPGVTFEPGESGSSVRLRYGDGSVIEVFISLDDIELVRP